MTATTEDTTQLRRRDRQQQETRRDLALAAFDLARANGLANVRVPEIAAEAGVSTRTFNNYFASKEEAIAWPATQRAGRMAANLGERSPEEPLAQALVNAITDLYSSARTDGLPTHWLRDFRSMVAKEPSLHGEYLKASVAAERELGEAVARRTHAYDELQCRVLAAMVVGAERAAVMYWMAHRQGPLMDAVRTAVIQATSGIEAPR